MSDKEKSQSSLSYRDAGVNIDAENQDVEEMKEDVRSTYHPEMIGDLGGFGGLFAFNAKNMKNQYSSLVPMEWGPSFKLLL